MQGRSIVYLICGFIGAGKATFARKLEEKTGAVRITKDEWSIRLIGNDPTIDGYGHGIIKSLDYQGMLHSLSQRRALMSLSTRDFGEKNNEMRRRITALGATAILYYVETPIETIRERVVARNNNLTNDSFEISREMLEHYLMHWQPPGEDEDYILAGEVQ